MKIIKYLILVVVILFVIAVVGVLRTPPSNDPGAAELRAAEKLISSNRHGVANGNTEEAQKLAQAFSKAYQAAREELVEGAKHGSMSMTDGEFPTFCQLNDDAVVILVQVPKLRKFSDDAKEVIVDAGWQLANMAASRGLESPPTTLVLGVRGLVRYEALTVGELSDSGEYTATSELDSSIDLRQYFVTEGTQEEQATATEPTEELPVEA